LIWLARAPLFRRCDHVSRQVEFPQYLSGTQCLITGDTHPYTHAPQRCQAWPHVWIQIILAKPFRLANVSAPRALSVQVEARAKILKDFPVIHAQGNDRTEYRGKRMAGYA